jgi:vacuolar-type H+-ATPase subunit E/Vma4
MEIQIEDMEKQLDQIHDAVARLPQGPERELIAAAFDRLTEIQEDMKEEFETQKESYQDKEAGLEMAQSALNSTREYLEGVWKEQNRTTGVNPRVDELLKELDDALEDCGE